MYEAEVFSYGICNRDLDRYTDMSDSNTRDPKKELTTSSAKTWKSPATGVLNRP